MSEMLPPSWSEMSQQIERGERSQAWKKAGAWAVERLAQHLGERWPQDVWEKYSDLPGGMKFASSHTVAFVELLELALRLELVRDLPRFVSLRRALRTDARGELVRHVRIQLEVAALGLRHGHHVDFEPPIPNSSKRGDLAMDVGSEEPILIETRALLIDNRTRETNAFTDELFWRIRLAVSPYGAECSGTVSKGSRRCCLRRATWRDRNPGKTCGSGHACFAASCPRRGTNCEPRGGTRRQGPDWPADRREWLAAGRRSTQAESGADARSAECLFAVRCPRWSLAVHSVVAGRSRDEGNSIGDGCLRNARAVPSR